MVNLLLQRLVVVLSIIIGGLHTGAWADDAAFSSAKIQKLRVIVLDNESDYTVIDSRMDEDLTGVVLFGLIGGIATTAAHSSADDKKADAYREAAASIKLKPIIEAALLETLRTKSEIKSTINSKDEAFTLNITIKKWGLRRMSQEDSLMQSFLQVQVSMDDEKGNEIWDTRNHSVGKTPRLLSDFTEEIFVNEIQTLARKSGEYIGYQILYR